MVRQTRQIYSHSLGGQCHVRKVPLGRSASWGVQEHLLFADPRVREYWRSRDRTRENGKSNLPRRCLQLGRREAQKEQLCAERGLVRSGSQERGSETMTAGVTSGPITSYDGWFGRGRGSGIYLKIAIKKICLSKGKMAFLMRAADVCDELTQLP